MREKKRKKELRKKQLLGYVKNLELKSTRQVVNLNENKLMTHLVTLNACWRPDIYLDNGRYCDGCVLFEACACKIKRVRKKVNT